MEVGTEISQKIRSAIKAKLMELGAYVDDELPDYIMVMVANKKNKSQMKTDLSLFLGTNTDTFTSWLHGLLGKLQTITVESTKDKPAEPEKSKKEKKKDKSGLGSQKSKKVGKDKSRKRKSSKDDGDNAPKVKAAMSETAEKENTSAEINNSQTGDSEIVDNETQGLNEGGSSQVGDDEPEASEGVEANSVKQTHVQEEFEDVRQLLVAATPGDELAKELDAVEEEISNVKKSHPSQSKGASNKARTSNSSVATDDSQREQKSKKKVPSSVVATVCRDEDDEEYNPFNPAVGSVASVVKVTSRKTSFPPSMQANRALLVKAMSDAEKSVATKRKVAVTRPINRQSSPGEYSPKRKRSTHRETASPPPYIPSRKKEGSASISSLSRSSGVVVKQKVLSRDDIRHTLGHEDSRSLLSGSKKEELVRRAANDGSMSSLVSAKSHTVHSATAQSSSSILRRPSKDVVEVSKSRNSSSNVAASRREVRGVDRESGEVKNFQITARVGPMRSAPAKENISETVNSESDRSLRVTVISGQSDEPQLNLDLSPERTAKKTQVLARSSSEKSRSAVVRDARDLLKLKQSKSLLTENKGRGARVISKLAREAVQKQCKAAVMSVRKASSVSARTNSPDSRVVQCDSKSPSVDSHHNEDSDTSELQYDDASASEEGSVTKVVIQNSPKPSVSPDRASPKTTPARRHSVKKEVDEVEDLSQMLEEDLDSALLLEEEVKNEFTLDLDDEELSHVVEEVAAEVEPDKENDESKSGIRFIVTLDGVDEAQFDDRAASARSEANVAAGVGAIRPMNSIPSQSHHQLVSTLPPSTPTRPLLAAAMPSPQLASTPAQVATKIRPPRIQPFSISLKDSDDEHEEKIVTYVQASDASALESIAQSGNGRELSVLQQARSQERCRFWPACMAGSDCQYHHPTSHCKTFPNCKFGDKCLFIHPNCKFDSKCVRADCPFTHSSKRHPSQLVAPAMPPPRPYPRYSSMSHSHPPQQAVTCHYFPNCLNPNCPFVHPKPCMFGPACKNPVCPFYHPVVVSPPVISSTVPDKGKLKWQAQPHPQPKVAAVKPSAARSATVSSTSL